MLKLKFKKDMPMLKSKSRKKVPRLENLLYEDSLTDADLPETVKVMKAHPGLGSLFGCQKKYYKKHGILYGCDHNMIRPRQFGNVMGIVCIHKDGTRNFTRNTIDEAYKEATSIR